MVGQFVSAERSGIRSLNVRNRRLVTGESREETIANAKRRFQEVATALQGLNDYHVDRAVQCYKLALMHNFTQGRKQSHVIAACLYTVCRQEKTMHMLIDFSDVLHSNVFTLGNTFMQFTRLVNIQLPLIDPSLYLIRFAGMMELGDKTHVVTQDAIRLVQRMKRDWIHFGRRPAGICGACLLLAARMHGFRRSQKEIIHIVKICNMTLRHRLNEFAETASASLTIDQFRVTDLSTEANPPSFRRSRHKAAQPLSQPQLDAPQQSDADIMQEMNEALQSTEIQQALRKWTDQPVSENPEEWSDIDDSELEHFLLKPGEIADKTVRWEAMNQEWVDLQDLKRKQREKAASGQPAKKPRKATGRRNIVRASTPAETTKEVIIQKAPVFSKKINYAALDQLFQKSSIPQAVNVVNT